MNLSISTNMSSTNELSENDILKQIHLIVK